MDNDEASVSKVKYGGVLHEHRTFYWISQSSRDDASALWRSQAVPCSLHIYELSNH